MVVSPWSSVVGRWSLVAALCLAWLVPGFTPILFAQQLPELTEPVNDFAKVIDSENAAAIDRMSRALKQKTGDVVIVVTVNTIEPFADINEYTVRLFENHGRGIGERGKDNGVLIVLAMKERRSGSNLATVSKSSSPTDIPARRSARS